MTAILIVAHAPLASAMAQVAAHTYPECAAQLAALDIERDASLDEVERRVRQSMHTLGQVDTLILTDVVGATPHSGASRVAEGGSHVRVVAGLNVPMLWRTLCYRAEPLEQLAVRACDGGRLGVLQVASTRPANQANATRNHAQDPHHDQQ
jgi:mannose PTS system EIIA component